MKKEKISLKLYRLIYQKMTLEYPVLTITERFYGFIRFSCTSYGHTKKRDQKQSPYKLQGLFGTSTSSQREIK